MNLKKEYQRFESDYDTEIKDMLILTSNFISGASLFSKGIWRPSAEFLASIDCTTNQLNQTKGHLNWLAEDKDKNGWIYHLKPLTIYHIKYRENHQNQLASHDRSYMLVDVLERHMHHPQLEAILKDYQRPVFLKDEQCGTFVLDREMNWFSADVNWLDKKCSVSLECDEEDGETAHGSLAHFQKIYSHMKEWDDQFRKFAAEKLTDLANDWLEESDEDDVREITQEMFSQKICMNELVIDKDGNYTAYYDDGDMFWGHVIWIEGNMNTCMEDADIAG